MPTSLKPIPAPAPGVYEGVPSEIYHAWDAVNASTLKALADTTPHHVNWDRMNPEPPPNLPPPAREATLDIGTAWHTLCLQPEEYDRYVVELPELDFRTKEAKTYLADVKASRVDFPSVYLRPESAAKVRAMAEAMKKHSTADALLRLPGRVELSVVWVTKTASGRDALVKVRFDKITDPVNEAPVVIVDLKSAQSAKADDFSRAIVDMKYHWSAGLYMAIARECPDLPNPEGFIFAVQEKERDFPVACYRLDAAAIQLGEQKVREMLDVWVECATSGVWPGYDSGLTTISVPSLAWPKRAEGGI